MKKFYFFICTLLFFNFSFSQNSEIKIVGGNLVPTSFYYCTPPTLNFEVDDFFSAAAVTDSSKQISDFNSILNDLTDEQDIIFREETVPDNEFSTTIDLGFRFRFFNKTYTHLVVGSNGRLVFAEKAVLDNLNGKTNYIDRTFSGNRLPLPENPPPAPPTPITPGTPIPSTKYNRIYYTGDVDRELKMAQIFAGYTKLKVNSPTGNYKYKKFNDVVSRKKGILITFQSVIPTNGIGGDLGPIYTSRVIIFEDGRIVLNVKDKTEGSYNAILGMQNEDGDIKIIPENLPKYNNQDWASQSSVAYVITTGSTRTPTYLWELDRDNDGIIDQTSATRFFPNYNPSSDVEKLSVKISFAETTDIKTSSVEFKKVSTPVIEKIISGCSIILKVNTATYNSDLTYKWYRDGDPSPLTTNRELPLSSSSFADDYYAIPIKSDGTTCLGSNKIKVKKFFPTLIKNRLTLCDNSAAPADSKIVNLFAEFYLRYSASSAFEEYEVDFFDSSGNIIIDPTNYLVPKNQDVSVTVKRKLRQSPQYCETDILHNNFISIPNAINIPVCYSATVFDLKNYFKNNFPAASHIYNFTYVGGESAGDGSSVDVTRSVLVSTNVLSSTCSTTTSVTFTPGSTISAPSIPIQERCAGADNSNSRFDFNFIKTLLDPTNQYDIKFFKKSNNIEIVPVSPTPSSGANLNNEGYFWSDTTGDYIIYAKLSNPSDPTCFAISDDIILRVNILPTARSDYHSKLKRRACASSTVNLEITDVFDLIATNSHDQIPTIKYFDQSGNQLFNADITNYNISRGIPYIEIQNENCLPPLKLNYEIISEVFPLRNPESEVICDDFDGNADGKIKVKIASDFFKSKFTADFARTTFNYYDGTSLIHTSSTLNDIFEYEITDNKTITVKVSSDQYCENTSTINFKVNNPTAIQISGNVNLCFNGKLELNIYNFTDFNSLQWFDPNGNPIATGKLIFVKYEEVLFGKTYKVIGTNANGCISEIIFTPSDGNQPKIQVINQTNNSIEVIAEGGSKPYTYYFNGVAQSSNVLQNPTASSYEIKVESATGCFGPPQTVYFIKINNAFTPNGDGINDIWKIENIDKMERVSIQIVDRNGAKVFESTTPDKSEWDGKMNGRALPTSTYWYVVSWYDAVTQKTEQRQGWILLKNRD